jgi:hypothetical protein
MYFFELKFLVDNEFQVFKEDLEGQGVHAKVVCWINQIPKESQDSSHKDMVSGGQKLDCKTICILHFGAYVQLHENRL